MVDETLSEYVRERMTEFDPDIDTGPQSDFYRIVLGPLLTRLGPSPLATSVEQFLLDVLSQQYPDVDTSEGTAIRDLVIRFAQTALEPVRREIEFVRTGDSFDNADSWTRDELDARMGNFFLSLTSGRRVQAVLRVFFRSPQTVTVTTFTEFRVGSNRYFPTGVQSITSSTMRFNRSGGLYYFDVAVQAEEAGTAYDLEIGQSATTSEILGVDSIQVQSLTVRGVDEETTDEAVARVQESITQRNLITVRGIRLVLPDDENFPELGHVEVIGFGDEEMQRDVVRGPATVSEIPGGILGFAPPSFATAADEVHIGGKTDVYIQVARTTFTMEIDNPANIGRFLFESRTGYTLDDPDGGVAFLHDDRVVFNRALVAQPGYSVPGGLEAESYSGFYLRIGGNEAAVRSIDPAPGSQFVEVYTDASGSFPVAFAGPLAGDEDPVGRFIRTNGAPGFVELAAGVSSIPYAAFFRDHFGDPHAFGHARGFIADVPLWASVALDADEDPVIDASGDPIAQEPGAEGRTQLADSGGSPVLQADVYFAEDPFDVGTLQQGPNVASSNLQTPLVLPTKLELVSTVNDEVIAELPYAQVLRVEAVDDIAPGERGTVRVWFRDAVSCAAFRDRMAATTLISGTDRFRAMPVIAYSAEAPTLGDPWPADYTFDGPTSLLRVVVDGTTVTLPVVDNAGAPVTIAAIAGLIRLPRAGDRLVYWRTLSGAGDYEDAVVLTIEEVQATALVVHWPAGDFPPAASSGWTANRAGFAICQGSLAADAVQDTATGLYHVDFEFEADAGNAATLLRETELTWLDAASSADFDAVITGAVESPFRAEGWQVLPHLSVLSFSVYERPHLRLSWQISDQYFFFDPPGLGTSVGAPRLRLTYESSDSLADVEVFVDDDDNRIVAEETLVRSLLPARVRGAVTYAGGGAQETVQAAVEAFLSGLSPSSGLEISDVVGAIQDEGAHSIRMPVSLTVLRWDVDRVARVEVVTDQMMVDRLLQPEADPDHLTLTRSGD